MNLLRLSSSWVVGSSLALMSFVSMGTALAQSSATTAAVADYVKAEMKHQHIPGLALLVVKNGKTIVSEGFGLANVELQVPVKPETVFSVRVRRQAVHGNRGHDAGGRRQDRP